MQTRKYQDKDTGADRYSTEIVCESMKMLGGRPDSDRGLTAQGEAAAQNVQNAFPGSGPVAEPDCPF